MAASFASATPSAQADASRTNEFADARTVRVPRSRSVSPGDGLAHQAGAKSKSSLKRTK